MSKGFIIACDVILGLAFAYWAAFGDTSSWVEWAVWLLVLVPMIWASRA